MTHKIILRKFRKKRVSSFLDPFSFLLPPSIQTRRFYDDRKALVEVLKKRNLYSSESMKNLHAAFDREVPKITGSLYAFASIIISAFFFGLSPYTQIDIVKSVTDPNFPRYMSSVWSLIGVVLMLIAIAFVVIYVLMRLIYKDESKICCLLTDLSIRISRK